MSTRDVRDDTNAFLRETDRAAPTHPRCPECAVPMWLVVVERVDGKQRKHFQCKACDAKFIQLADAPADGVR
jgi:transposase-like protein